MAALHKCKPSIAENPCRSPVFKARFPQRSKQIDVVRLPVRIAKIAAGEAVDFGNALDDFLCSRDDLSRGEEP